MASPLRARPRTQTPDDTVDVVTDAYGTSTHQPPGDGVIYAPYLIPRWSKTTRGELIIYYALSTWQPYTVILMRTTLSIGC